MSESAPCFTSVRIDFQMPFRSMMTSTGCASWVLCPKSAAVEQGQPSFGMRRWSREQGAVWLWCDAREVAFPFYERMGFKFVSEGYHVPEIGPHRMMALKL